MASSIKKRKVLIIPEFNEFGGALTYLKALIHYYIEFNYDIKVCITFGNHHPEIVQLLKSFNIELYTIKRRRHGFKNFWEQPVISFIQDIAITLKVYYKFRPDLITVSNIRAENFLGLVFFRIPFLCVIHTYPSQNLSKNIIVRFNIWLQKGCFAYFFNESTKKIIAVSEYSKNEIVKWLGIPAEAISVVHNFGRQVPDLTPTISKDRKTIVLTFGHVTTYKNPLTWIKVAEKVINNLPEDDIEFIWGGDGELFNDCIGYVASAKMESKIKFIGYTSDVSKYYKAASLYFQPSLMESHGIAVVDAMAYSLPCVVSNIGGLPESVQNGVNGFLVSPGNVNAFSESIIRIITDRMLAKEMGDKSLLIFNQKFTQHLWREKMILLHNEILNGALKR